MSVTVEMVGDSARRNKSGEAITSKRYAVTGASSATDANDAVSTYLTSVLGFNKTLGSLELDSIEDEEEVEGVYYATANWRTYSRSSPLSLNETTFSFQLSVQPVSIKVPRSVYVYKNNDTPDFSPQLINDVGDGEEPNGVDVYEPVYEESKTIVVSSADLDSTYRTYLKNTVGKTNDSEFNGHSRGEVLLMGVSGQRRGEGETELTFRWQVRRNQFGISLGGISNIDKKGWEYLWPRSELRSSSGGPSVKVITHICVATVFEEANYSGLGI